MIGNTDGIDIRIGRLWIPVILWVFVFPSLYHAEIISGSIFIVGLVFSAVLYLKMTVIKKETK